MLDVVLAEENTHFVRDELVCVVRPEHDVLRAVAVCVNVVKYLLKMKVLPTFRTGGEGVGFLRGGAFEAVYINGVVKAWWSTRSPGVREDVLEGLGIRPFYRLSRRR